MKYLRARLTHGPDTMHPVHAFEQRHDAFEWSQLLHWNPSVGDVNTVVFRVCGDPDLYADALDDHAPVVAYSLADGRGDTFYACISEEFSGTAREMAGAFAGTGVVVVPPVDYRGDGTVDLSLVGAAADLQAVLGGLPDDIGVDVVELGEYDARRTNPAARLTDRQREAVAAAVDVGYYGATRDGSVAEVADRLGCAPGTAAEHLRKAEATVMGRVAGGPGPGPH